MKLQFLLIVLIATAVYAGTIFEDDFSDGSDDGWLRWTSGYAANASYNVVDEQYHLMNSGSGWIPAASHTGDLAGGTMSTPDYSFLAEVTPEACYRAGILARGYMPSFTGYILVMIPSENKLVLARMISSGPQTLDQLTLPLQFNQTYWLRLDLAGTSIQGKIWQGTAGDEPTEWMVSATDGQYQNPGRIAAFCCNFSSDTRASTSVYYDNIVVTSDGAALQTVSWAGVKTALN